MFEAIMMFIPEEAYILVLVAAGILMICGARVLASGLFVMVILLSVLGPFIDAFISNLPPALFIGLCLVCLLMLFKIIVGPRVAGNLASFLIYDLIRVPFRIIGWLFSGFSRRRPL